MIGVVDGYTNGHGHTSNGHGSSHIFVWLAWENICVTFCAASIILCNFVMQPIILSGKKQRQMTGPDFVQMLLWPV